MVGGIEMTVGFDLATTSRLDTRVRDKPRVVELVLVPANYKVPMCREGSVKLSQSDCR